jgi:hypothetical protein
MSDHTQGRYGVWFQPEGDPPPEGADVVPVYREDGFVYQVVALTDTQIEAIADLVVAKLRNSA